MGCSSEMLFEVSTEQISTKNRYSLLLVRSKGKSRWKVQKKRNRMLLMW